MIVQLPTKPDFLRSTFPRTRYSLEGNWVKVRPSHRGVLIFANQAAEFDELESGFQVLESDSQVLVEEHFATNDVVVASALDRPSKPRKSFAKTLVNGVLTLVIVASVLVGAALFAPRIYYTFVPADTALVWSPEDGTPFGGSFDRGADATSKVLSATDDATLEPYQPPFDPTLPEGSWLVIPRIGVRTELQRTADAEEALKTGVWQVPEFGVPGDSEKPVILAAHRFGWKWWWQSEYWKYHSFYLLPDTQPGDRIEIIADQRKWIYEIYAGEEGVEITDYEADVILYTCKFLDSPLRHIRYARLINPDADTQALGSLEFDF
jgi:hypothetical protein